MDTSSYQVEKFIKHTAPTGLYPVNSVFEHRDWPTVKDYFVVTAASGCLEIDDQGRKNLIYFAGRKVGLRYENGVFTAPCSGVKLVCTEDAWRIHGFPSEFHPESRQCAACGRAVPIDLR